MSDSKRKAIKVTTHKRPVGPCPGCGATIDAEVTVSTYLDGDVTIGDDGTPTVSTSSEIGATRVIHRCDGKKAAQLEVPTGGEEGPVPKVTRPRVARKTAAAKAGE